jgi:hypothetical protein
MGYGEVGGNGSVQVSVHLKHPSNSETEEGAPATVHRNADANNQRSPRAKANAGVGAPGRAYRGKDRQGPGFPTADPDNVFTVVIEFTRLADLNAAKAAIGGLTSVPATLEFPLKVVDSPGQVHVRWPDEKPAARNSAAV